MLVSSSKRPALEQHRHVLAGARGLDERGGEDVVLPHAVERRSDRGDGWIGRRRAREGLDGFIALVRMEEDDIAAVDALERLQHEPVRATSRHLHRREFGLRRSVVGDLRDEPQIERRRDLHHLFLPEPEGEANGLPPEGRKPPLDLEVADAPVEATLERGRQVGPVEGDPVDARHADHAELVKSRALAAEEEVWAQAQQLPQANIHARPPRDREHARDAVRHAYQGGGGRGAAGEVERLAAHVADGLGADDVRARGHLLREVRAEVALLLQRQLRRREDANSQPAEVDQEGVVRARGQLGLRVRLAQHG